MVNENSLSNLTLLYVEDEADIREEMESFLELRVKTLYVAKDGEEGWDLFQKYKPDIVISDINMPRMNGIEMSEKIKNENKSIPIILITAFSDAKYMINAIDLGIDKYILKPVEITKLQKTLNATAKILIDKIKLLELSNQIEEMRLYDIEQQNIAKEKLEAGIINDIDEKECKILSIPSDILSGDFYSIYKREDGSTFIYLIDGQGHGISPALTVFAVSSIINQIVYGVGSLTELIERLYPTVKTFLGEIEQLSYTMIMISSNRKSLSYSSGGMYPFLIKTGSEIIKIKANNTPFMNFSHNPVVNDIEINGWESLLVYSDGMVEEESVDLSEFKPELLIEDPSLINNVKENIGSQKLEDDLTLLYLECVENEEGNFF